MRDLIQAAIDYLIKCARFQTESARREAADVHQEGKILLSIGNLPHLCAPHYLAPHSVRANLCCSDRERRNLLKKSQLRSSIEQFCKTALPVHLKLAESICYFLNPSIILNFLCHVQFLPLMWRRCQGDFDSQRTDFDCLQEQSQ